MLRYEGLAHLGADLEGLRTDGRPQPDQHLIDRAVQRGDAGLQDPGRQPTPAGMRRRHAAAGTVAEQHRQAVGGHDGTGDAGGGTPAGVGLGDLRRISFDHRHAVHLSQPGRLAAEQRLQAPTIFGHGSRIVADMVTEVEAVERRLADATGAGGHAGVHVGRSRPVGDQQITEGQTHPMNASRSPRSRLSSSTRSSGSADSQPMRSPVTG
ncbi:hypothetical protein D3C75_675170 [compost metagenome]